MKLTSILKATAIKAELESDSKKSVIEELASFVASVEPGINADNLANILSEREELGSTGIGSGVAIPHGKMSHLSGMVAAFCRSTAGVPFDSQDGEPVHLFFTLVAPENAAGLHLKVLAKLSRMLKEDEFREKLLKAKDENDLYQIILANDVE